MRLPELQRLVVGEEKPEVFSSGLPVKCNFKNGWYCKKCGTLTEHYLVKHNQVCRVCHDPVNVVHFERFSGYLHLSTDWLIQNIRGIDYTENFGRDSVSGFIIYHGLTSRRQHFRVLSECGIWVDGEKLLGYTEMETEGVALKRRLF